MSSERRIYVTGLGPISAFGVGIEPLWDAMLAGRSAIAPISQWDASGFPCSAAAVLPPDRFDVKSVVPKSYRKATKVMARDIELAVGAAAQAVRSAGLVTRATEGAQPTLPPERVGCHIGAGLIAAEIDELTGALATARAPDGSFDVAAWGDSGMQNLTPLWLLKYLPNMLACHVTIIHDCQGPSNTITCAEASSGLSIGESMRVIERGDADACLSGGADCRINPMGVLRQHFAGRLAPTPPEVDPTTVLRPFDPAANGSILGEGGGILVLEAEESAKARGADLSVELAGFAATQCACDDSTGTTISGGDEIADAIRGALGHAALRADDVDAVVPLGSAIPNTDAAEADAIASVFGARAAGIPVVQIAPFVGNCGAGAGALAVAIAAQVIRTQTLPARVNTRNCTRLDANAAPSRPARVRNVVVTGTSLGGQSAAVVLRQRVS